MDGQGFDADNVNVEGHLAHVCQVAGSGLEVIIKRNEILRVVYSGAA